MTGTGRIRQWEKGLVDQRVDLGSQLAAQVGAGDCRHQSTGESDGGEAPVDGNQEDVEQRPPDEAEVDDGVYQAEDQQILEAVIHIIGIFK